MPTAEPLQVPPPPSVDIVMASSASTAGQQAAADAEGTQPTNDSGTSANEHIQSYTPDQKKIEVLRIKSWPAFAHYEFLEITPEATRTEIETAYHQKALLTHTDRNSDRDAKEAFQSKWCF
jgi:DnaJ-class molecular chaperone